jgi:hypothetical protein
MQRFYLACYASTRKLATIQGVVNDENCTRWLGGKTQPSRGRAQRG